MNAETQLNPIQSPSSESSSIISKHNHSHHHKHQDQLLPPVPASVLTPFFVPLQDQDFLSSNKSIKTSEINLFKPSIELTTRKNDFSQQLPSYEKTEKPKDYTTTLKSIENLESLKLEDSFHTTTPFISSSLSPKVNEIFSDDFNKFHSTKATPVTGKPAKKYHFEDSDFIPSHQLDNYNSVHSTKNTLITEKPFNDNYRYENSNPQFSRPKKIEKFTSVFNISKPTSYKSLPTPPVQTNFFTLEDAVTIRPFRDYDRFSEMNKIPNTVIRENPLDLDVPQQINPTESIRQSHKTQQPVRHHTKTRMEPPSPSSTLSTSTTTQTITKEVLHHKQRIQTDKRINHQHMKNWNKFEPLSSERPLNFDDNRPIIRRRKPHFKNSKRYQSRRNNTMEFNGLTATASSIHENSIQQLPISSISPSSTMSTSTSTTSSNNRPNPLLTMNKVPYSKNLSSLRPMVKTESFFSHNQTPFEKEPPADFTQTSTISATGLGSSVDPTTLSSNLDLQETLEPTMNVITPSKASEQQTTSTHYPPVVLTSSQLPPSSSSSLPETTKRRHRLKNRKQGNGISQNLMKESLLQNFDRPIRLEPTEQVTSATILNKSKEFIKNSTTDPTIKVIPSERPKFSIRKYHRQRLQKNSTDFEQNSIITTTSTTTPEPIQILSSASTIHERNTTNFPLTTRRRLLPSLKLRIHHQNETTEATIKKRKRPEIRGEILESSTTKNNRESNNGESSNEKQSNNRRNGSDVRRNRYTYRNGNTVSKETSSKEIDSSLETSSSTSTTTLKDGLLMMKNTSSLLRRPPRISLKERIQNHLNRKNNTVTNQTNQNTDDLLNITLETKNNGVESTTISSSTAKIESAIMKIAKDDHHSYSQRTSSNNLNSRSSSSSNSKFSHSSSSSSSPSSSSSSKNEDMNNISRYVDELTASSSSNSLNILNKGLHTRRIPNYFTIATEDPILPIEAFFPNVLKESKTVVKENVKNSN